MTYQEVANNGFRIALVTYSNIEMSLYRYKGHPYEIWFDVRSEEIVKFRNIRGSLINPYLKYVKANDN